MLTIYLKIKKNKFKILINFFFFLILLKKKSYNHIKYVGRKESEIKKDK